MFSKPQLWQGSKMQSPRLIRPIPITSARNRLSSQAQLLPRQRWLHASQRVSALEERKDVEAEEQQLTGAAKLFAEAEREEAEEARRPKRVTIRSSVAVDDSPVWTGEESTRDAVLRMLVDSHKPLRGDFRTADARMKDIVRSIDTTPIIRDGPSSFTDEPSSSTIAQRTLAAAIEKERAIPAEQFKPWHAKYVTQESAQTPSVFYGKFMHSQASSSSSLLDRPALPTDPKARKAALEKNERDRKRGRLEGAREGALDYRLGGGQGYQAKGSSAAGGGVRGGPSGMRAWQSLVEDRIERARAAGWFNNVQGRGQPLVKDMDQHNPHIDRSEYFMNRIVKKQGAKPPWIEVLSELDTAHTSFRTSLLASYTRSLVRSLVTNPFHDRSSLEKLTAEDVEALRDSTWQAREAAYHAEAIQQLNSLVRKMNNIAPQPVRRGLVNIDDELRRMYRLSGPVVLAELAKRREAGWDTVGGTGSDEKVSINSAGLGGGGPVGWEFDLGFVKGVKRALNRTGLFRIHVLGVGAIGTLLASHLRHALQPVEEYPITLMLSRRGLPNLEWPGDKELDRRWQAGEKHQPWKTPRPVTLTLERSGSTLVSSDFDCEVVGPAIASAGDNLDRIRSFAPSGSSHRKLVASREAFERSPYVGLDTPIQCMAVTLKTHQTLEAVKAIRHRLNKDSVIVLLQNGMGVYDELCRDVWPDARRRPEFILGSTTHGVAMTHRAREVLAAEEGDRRGPQGKELVHRMVIHHGLGDIKFGVVPSPRRSGDYDSLLFPDLVSPTTGRMSLISHPPSPAFPLPTLLPGETPSNLDQILPILLSLTPLSPSLLPISMLQHTLLLKLVVNCAINPLTAILNVPNGALLDRQSAEGRWAGRMIRRITSECSAVVLSHFASLVGAHKPRSGSSTTTTTYHPASIPPELTELFSPRSLEKRVLEVCASTASNTSSMLSSVRAGQYTEIEYINGYVVELGERLGVSTRWNEEVRRRVRGLTGEKVKERKAMIEAFNKRTAKRLAKMKAERVAKEKEPVV